MDIKFKFPTPFDWNVRDPVTLHELRMRMFVAMVQEKPRWWEKVFDDALVLKWKEEMQEYDCIAVRREERRRSLFLRPLRPRDVCNCEETADDLEEEEEDGDGRQRWPRDPVTALQLEWIFSFLKYSARQRDEATGCLASSNSVATTTPCVYEAADIVPEDLRTSLVLQAGALESVPDEEKDWHPGSNRQVLDLVHPSLYCFRIGHTRVLRPAKDVASVADPTRKYTAWDYFDDRPSLKGDMFRSEDFQWLPTDFEISESGDVKALSYINNLHPIRHRHLSETVTSVLQCLVPLFEKTLSDVLSPTPPLAILADPMNWYSDLPPEPDAASDEQKHWEWRMNKRPCIPDPAPFEPPSPEGRIALSLKGRTVQVIVKLANIVLTPENPRYAGGSWHVEGTSNEQVVATGLFYYACANLTPSRLTFRSQVGADPDGADTHMPYQHDDNDGWGQAFGLGRDDAMNQGMGQVVAREGKCVVFPNVYQHRVLPFELADKREPGYRKTLCFFLVDPFERVVSSSSVPPQQREWYVEEMERVPALRRLPPELYDMIAGYALEGTMTREEAEEVREELMEERRNFVVEHNETVFEVPFNLCEH